MEKVVSVAMARRILGSASNELTDTQVIEMLTTLKLLGNEQLLYNGSKVDESIDELNTPNT